jgi:hypothetical protein
VSDSNPTPNFDPETGEWAWDRDDRLWREEQARLGTADPATADEELKREDPPAIKGAGVRQTDF